jgi:catechol 2,3-dioxygenase
VNGATSTSTTQVVGDPMIAKVPHRIGRIALIVRDLQSMARFYQRVIGLKVMDLASNRAALGAGDAVLVELRHDPAAPLQSRREAGLFHTAFLLPSRADLGAWIAHAGQESVRLTGAADHLVSEAVYLSDPEGNGIEVYVDRPSDAWPRHGGMIEMASEPLDLGGLAAAAAGHDWSGFPENGTVGHVHLQVGDIPAAEDFYVGVLGLDLTCRYQGASFFGSGGYHHQMAANVWNSQGATERSEGAAGLDEVEILVAPHILAAVRAKLDTDGVADEPDELFLRDPWGTGIRLRVE